MPCRLRSRPVSYCYGFRQLLLDAATPKCPLPDCIVLGPRAQVWQSSCPDLQLLSSESGFFDHWASILQREKRREEEEYEGRKVDDQCSYVHMPTKKKRMRICVITMKCNDSNAKALEDKDYRRSPVYVVSSARSGEVRGGFISSRQRSPARRAPQLLKKARITLHRPHLLLPPPN